MSLSLLAALGLCVPAAQDAPLPLEDERPLVEEVVLTLREGESLAGLHVAPHGQVVAILDFDGGQVLASGAYRSQVYERVWNVSTGETPLAVSAVGWRDGMHHLITTELEETCPEPIQLSFLEGDLATPLYRWMEDGEPVWAIAGPDQREDENPEIGHGPPALGSNGLVLGFRVRAFDLTFVWTGEGVSSAYAWASHPITVRRGGEEVPFYRGYDGEEMHVRYGDVHLRAVESDEMSRA